MLRGFSMLEMVVVMSIMALVAAIVLPRINSGTSPTQLRAIALQVTSLLRQTRLHALDNNGDAIFKLDTSERYASSSSNETKILEIPKDITLAHEISTRCTQTGSLIEVVFRGDGRSCGSQITMQIDGLSAVIQTNWLVGKSSVKFQ